MFLYQLLFIGERVRDTLDSIYDIINKTFPIPGRFRSSLPSDIAELSRLLTNNRGERSLSYLNRPNYLSAYLRYFLPWNLYRLCLLLPGLDIKLLPGDKIVDLGCGPLTFTTALWISRPDLRNQSLEFYCIDRSSPVLDAGKKLFTAVSGDCWKINLVRKDINLQKKDITGSHYGEHDKKAALVCAVNMFNENYERLSHNNTEGLRRIAANSAQLTRSKAADNASILTIEPGVPQSGRFISLLRGEFTKLGCCTVAPCTHTADCPLCGKKEKRWCHFAFEAADAPKELKRLSAAAGIPKERLVLSYLLTNTNSTVSASTIKNQTIRVISDAFRLPGNSNDRRERYERYGRYGCSVKGLILLSGEKSRIEKLASGSVFTSDFAVNGQRDPKSGALIIDL